MYIIQPCSRDIQLDHSYSTTREEITSDVVMSADSDDLGSPVPSPVPSPAPSSSLPLSPSLPPSPSPDSDADYLPSDDNNLSSEESGDENTANVPLCPLADNKIIVFKNSLNELFKFCSKCGSPVINRTEVKQGAMLSYRIECHSGHEYTWHSSPIENKQPVINLLLTASIVTTGNTYTRVSAIAKAMNLQYFSQTTYNKIQADKVFPVVQELWLKEEKKVREELRDDPQVILSGDGRCDSPGHNAKYCSYTLMDSSSHDRKGTNKIVGMELVQVSEVCLKK